MQFFYDGQIRRYLVQIVRLFSNFTVKYGDGTLHQIPVSYGDPDRQAAAIIRQNSENAIQSVPRIAVHIKDLQLDRSRLADATYVGKLNIRERNTYTDPTTGHLTYGDGQGKNYTVERLMPTPFKLTVSVDIWSSSTEQKLQILEQILVLFNPSLEIQTTDNYVDWTSLSVLDLTQLLWSSRQVPVGTNDTIDLATLTLEAPIWISPPAKVKNLGVIATIITSIFGTTGVDPVNQYIEGLGVDMTGNDSTMSDLLSTQYTTNVGNFGVLLLNSTAQILNPGSNVSAPNTSTAIPVSLSVPVNWTAFLAGCKGSYLAGSSKIYFTQPSGAEVSGTFTINPLDNTFITISLDTNTYPSNSILSPASVNNRTNGYSAGTFDAIIDPMTVYPGNGMTNLVAGDRFLIIEDIGAVGETTLAWGSFVAKTNDIIEWNGTAWTIVFDATQNSNTLLYQTNIYSGVQYKWNGVSWVKSFEGEYGAGLWRVAL
jgi:hypothetical protein